ncbi:MAG: sodium-dependent transporter [Myxococcales bacterium]|nr:sodium-dependent transporter [Myxococcales bacterium]
MAEERGHWGSRLGFILAAAGSAVGLGNLWKFPYLAWENDGGVFVLSYLAAVALFGLPIMIAEFMVGRRAQANPVVAFRKLGNRAWSGVGWLGVAAAAVILSYYTVIAGWSLKSFVQCLGWSFAGYDDGAPAEFGGFLSNGPLQILLTLLFSGLTAFIVYRGVGSGIERGNKIMMPALALILLYILVTALTLPAAGEGLAHLFVPRFSTWKPAMILDGLGQAFFSLSLGLGAMIAYGSYLKKDVSLPRAALSVTLLDTGVALVAGIIMFSIIHSIPGMKDQVSASSIGMLFVTLPKLFYTQMPGGALLGPLFFVLVAFAALTSTISLLEVLVSLLVDRQGMTRPRATLLSAGAVFAGSCLSALSLGAVSWLSSFSVFSGKPGVLSTLDHLAANWMLPLGGLFTTIFVGWFLKKDAARDELAGGRGWLFTLWLWLIRVVCPLGILALLLAIVMGKDFS